MIKWFNSVIARFFGIFYSLNKKSTTAFDDKNRVSLAHEGGYQRWWVSKDGLKHLKFYSTASNNNKDDDDSYYNNNDDDNNIEVAGDLLLEGFKFKYDWEKECIFIDDSSFFESVEDLPNFLRNVNNLLKLFKSLNVKGYLSIADNVPGVIDFIKHYNLSSIIRDSESERDRNRESALPYVTPYAGFDLNKWCYNLIILNLYLLAMKININIYMDDKAENRFEVDDITDLGRVIKDLESMLDPTILKRLQKVGLCITQNIYQGFDTEYEPLNSRKNLNELLSIQLAARSRLILKAPIVKTFSIEYLHPLTSEVKPKIVPLVPDIVVKSINETILKCRSVKHGEYDKIIDHLVECLKKSNLLKNFNSGDSIIFLLPHTELKQLFKFTNSYTLKELIENTDEMMDDSLKANSLLFTKKVNEIFKTYDLRTVDRIGDRIDDLLNLDKMYKAFNKCNSRFSINFKDVKVHVTTKLNLILCCHLSNADLSMLSDFEEFKNDLTIVNKNYVVLGRGLIFEDCRFKLTIRDTMLLAPGSGKALADIGKIYGEEFKKIDLKGYRGRMKALKEEDPKLFEEYAMRDALITLKHIIAMEEFNEGLNRTGVPLTLSSISKAYVMKEWETLNYEGYQMGNGYSFGKLTELITPKGLSSSGLMGLALNYYISSYRGGRNESFMFGVDRWTSKMKSKKWIDYDLSGAYPTAMVFLGDPDYSRIVRITQSWLDEASLSMLIHSYTVLHVTFKFQDNTLYPSIPCQVDRDISIYPISGESTITGLEYVLAKQQGCTIILKNGYYIPFMDVPSTEEAFNIFKKRYELEKNFHRDLKYYLSKGVRPFNTVIKELVIKRKEHPKGSFYNLMYKTIANSIYGLTAVGLKGKKKFDIQTGGSKLLEGGDLTNPLVASYITSFVRVVIGECLHNIWESEGKVVSVTTDGFITNLEDLEKFLLTKSFKKTLFFRMFLELRRFITDNPTENCLEVKNIEGFSEGDETVEEADGERGLISWTTRGQLGFTSGIKACTGFQSKGFSLSVLKEVFLSILESGDLTGYEYIQNSLRSAKDIYLKGGHVTKVYKDQSFKMVFDNKRHIIKPGDKSYDISNNLLDSAPWSCISECKDVRALIKLLHSVDYNHLTTKPKNKKYKSDLETAVRTFIKGLFKQGGYFGIHNTDLGSYNDIADFIKGFKYSTGLTVTKDSISKLKNRQIVLYAVPKNDVNMEFAQYVLVKYPNFKIDKFFSI